MNKATKGTIAAGAAVLLLLGTGGSLAYWNSTADLGGQTISAGQLKVVQDAAVTPTWTIKHTSGAATAVTDIAAVKLVPAGLMEEFRERATQLEHRPKSYAGAILVALIWVAAGIALAMWLWSWR